jgi:hypothetical protein
MTEEQRKTLLSAMFAIDNIDDTDAGESCRRVAMRMLAEVLGLELKPYRLLKESEVKPLYCPEVYAKSEEASE